MAHNGAAEKSERFKHALTDHKRWKQLTRWTHRRDRLPDTYRAIASLVSDHTHNN
ncbi:hypothetical protein OG215_38885 (plasmid) [Streptomyces globisporus]|nr:hypothetical protein OG215_38885 [Streptomyces globisporus]